MAPRRDRYDDGSGEGEDEEEEEEEEEGEGAGAVAYIKLLINSPVRPRGALARARCAARAPRLQSLLSSISPCHCLASLSTTDAVMTSVSAPRRSAPLNGSYIIFWDCRFCSRFLHPTPRVKLFALHKQLFTATCLCKFPGIQSRILVGVGDGLWV